MSLKTAEDIMVPIDEYPLVDSEATLWEVAIRLHESRREPVANGKIPYQAVLVADDQGNIVGKVGQMAIMRGLQPRSQVLGDLNTLSRAGVSEAVLESMLDGSRSLQMDFPDLCRAAAATPVKNVMHPVTEHIEVTATIAEVIHKLIAFQSLSALVTRDGHPIGLVRLADLCDEVVRQMLEATPPFQERG
ncbi:MAG TPA: CBS domain-containing protein [candidate division Zixibacteria bacterium]|nr:CBS domain-containing protein [candidate division Zixibacteria bacterium]